MAELNSAEAPVISPQEQIKPPPAPERSIATVITEKAKSLVSRISSGLNTPNANPDQILTEIANTPPEQSIPAPDSLKRGIQDHNTSTVNNSIEPNGENTTDQTALRVSEATEPNAPEFDPKEFQNVKKTVIVLQQYMKALGPNHPRTKAAAESILKSESVLQTALNAEGFGSQVISSLGSILESGTAIRGMSDFVKNITIRNSGQIEAGLQADSQPDVKAASLKLFTNLLSGDQQDAMSSQSITVGLSTLEQHMDTVQQGLRGELGKFDSSIMLRKMLLYGDNPVSDQVVAITQQIIKEKELERQANQGKVGLVEADETLVLFDSLLKNASPELVKKVKPLIGAKISHLDINTDRVVEAWAESGLPSKLSETVMVNVAAMESLEISKPGIVKALNNEYGISDFGRYPQDLLIQQYDDFVQEQANPTAPKKPYGIILNPQYDPTGAYYQDVELFGNFFQQMNALGYGVKVTEVNNKLGAVRSINKMRHQSGQISAGIIGGHGEANSIQIGKDPADGYITTEDLQRKGAGALSIAFVDKPVFVFNSCSTGIEGGIRDAAEKLHNGENLAPDRDMSIKTIKVSTLDNGELDFDLEYNEENVATRRNTGGVTPQSPS